MSMPCPECGETVEPEWDECPACEARLSRFCPECGRKILLHWQKCPECKTPTEGSPAQAAAPGHPEATRGHSERQEAASPGFRDVGYLKGNVHQDVHHHHYARGAEDDEEHYCPICSLEVVKGNRFKCPECQSDDLCKAHQVRIETSSGTRYVCEECAEKLQAAPLPVTSKTAEPTVYADWPFDATEARRRQEETSRIIEMPVECSVELSGGVTMAFILIPAGEAGLDAPAGNQERRAGEGPSAATRFEEPFYTGKFPVTQAQWESVMGGNPSAFKGLHHPVERVSWDDCQQFLTSLNSALPPLPSRPEPGRRLAEGPGEGGERRARPEKFAHPRASLPTAAEWEYACRSGSSAAYCFGEDRSALPDYGWFDKNSGRATHPVGDLKPNAWGLHDVHGNVWEWTRDLRETGDSSAAERRILCGGSWSYYGKQCRCESRHSAFVAEATPNYGFRLILRF